MDYKLVQSHKSSEIKKYFIAYFDILGIEDKLMKEDENKSIELFDIIDNIVLYSKEQFNNLKKTESDINIKMKVFSDNFLYYTEKEYISLIFMLGGIQAASITNDIFFVVLYVTAICLLLMILL